MREILTNQGTNLGINLGTNLDTNPGTNCKEINCACRNLIKTPKTGYKTSFYDHNYIYLRFLKLCNILAPN